MRLHSCALVHCDCRLLSQPAARRSSWRPREPGRHTESPPGTVHPPPLSSRRGPPTRTPGAKTVVTHVTKLKCSAASSTPSPPATTTTNWIRVATAQASVSRIGRTKSRVTSYVSPFWAGRFLDDWCTRTMCSPLHPMKNVARMVRSHRELILELVPRPGKFFSGVVEGFNGKTRAVIRRAYGFRTSEALEVALYHIFGARMSHSPPPALRGRPRSLPKGPPPPQTQPPPSRPAAPAPACHTASRRGRGSASAPPRSAPAASLLGITAIPSLALEARPAVAFTDAGTDVACLSRQHCAERQYSNCASKSLPEVVGQKGRPAYPGRVAGIDDPMAVARTSPSGLPEIRDRQHQAHQIRLSGDGQLLVDALQVPVDGVLRVPVASGISGTLLPSASHAAT